MIMLFSFLFIIGLYFLIPALIAQIFIPLAELAMPIWVSTNEGNLDIETQPLTAETKTREISN